MSPSEIHVSSITSASPSSRLEHCEGDVERADLVEDVLCEHVVVLPSLRSRRRVHPRTSFRTPHPQQCDAPTVASGVSSTSCMTAKVAAPGANQTRSPPRLWTPADAGASSSLRHTRPAPARGRSPLPRSNSPAGNRAQRVGAPAVVGEGRTQRSQARRGVVEPPPGDRHAVQHGEAVAARWSLTPRCPSAATSATSWARPLTRAGPPSTCHPKRTDADPPAAAPSRGLPPAPARDGRGWRPPDMASDQPKCGTRPLAPHESHGGTPRPRWPSVLSLACRGFGGWGS